MVMAIVIPAGMSITLHTGMAWLPIKSRSIVKGTAMSNHAALWWLTCLGRMEDGCDGGL
jgi:hypothetical protein